MLRNHLTGGTMYENIPVPKVTQSTFLLNGKKVTVTVVRDSAICRTLSDDEAWLFGRTIYVRGKIAKPSVLLPIIHELHRRLKLKWYQKIVDFFTR